MNDTQAPSADDTATREPSGARAAGGFEFPPPVDDGAREAASRLVIPDGPHPRPGAPYAFPPMVNAHVAGVASAPLPGDTLPADPTVDDDQVAQVVADVMAQVVVRSNTEFFRFHLAELHEAGQPALVTYGDGDLLAGLDGDNSGRKLTVLLPVEISPAGHARLRLLTLDKETDVVVGTALVLPAYLAARVEVVGGGSIRAWVSHALGPAFT